MTVQLDKRLLTIEEYHKMAEVGILKEDDRVELIYGEITKMSAITSEHAGKVNRVVRVLNRLLPLEKTVLAVQNPISIPELSSEPEPDISVLHYREDLYSENHPQPKDIIFLVEVAVSSLLTDRKVKSPLYAQAGVLALWIVNPKQKRIEVYSKPKNGEYSMRQTYRAGDTLHIELFDLEIKADDLLG
jgi:Uma2 family endonuclease